MDELQRSVWLLSTPVASEINRAMQEFTGIKFETSDQHKDLFVSRIKRDHEDGQRLLIFLEERHPLAGQETLMNLTTGEVADETTNVYEAYSLGELLIQDMHEKSVFD